IARACLLSTAASTATALRCVERKCRGRLLVVKIDLSVSWDVLRGCGPPVPPDYIAPVQTFLCIARRHLPDQSLVSLIGLLLVGAQFHELVRRTSWRVLFDPVDYMLQFVDTNFSGPFQSWRMDCQPVSIDVGRAARIFEWIDGQARSPICKARIGFLHARMSVMFVKRCNGERPPSLARIRIDLIPLVRDFEGPWLIRRPLQTCHAPNLIGRFPRRLHLHCGGQLVPRKCSRHCAADDRELGGRKPIEGCIDGAETQMSCRLAVISGLCLFTSKRCVLS